MKKLKKCMTFKVEYSEIFLKSLNKLDRATQRRIFNWIESHLSSCTDPRLIGKSLQYELKGLWRYRIGDYRLICEIKDEKLVILLLKIGHRKEIYSHKKRKDF